MGRIEFEKSLQRYRRALKEAQTRCQSQVVFPFSAGGEFNEKHGYILWDPGCGNYCLDRAGNELRTSLNVICLPLRPSSFRTALYNIYPPNRMGYAILYLHFLAAAVW